MSLGCEGTDGEPPGGLPLQMCAVADVGHAYRAFASFFTRIGELDRTIDPGTLPKAQILGTMNDVPCDCTTKH